MDGLALTLSVILLGAGPWVDVTSTAIPAPIAATLEKWMNLTRLQVLLVMAARRLTP